jgi:hypothetical protein
LDEAGKAQLQQATELAQLYSLNKCTPDLWQAIIDCVEAESSFSGMLRKLTVPLMHNGYALAKCRAACDWQFQHMSPAEADARLQQLEDSIHSSNAELYGAGALPTKPSCPVLLQTVVCLLAADWNAVKSSFASPAARSEGMLAAAAAAAASAVQAAADTARHLAAGNASAAATSIAVADSAAATACNNTHAALALAQAASAAVPSQMVSGPATGPATTAAEPARLTATSLESVTAVLGQAAAAPVGAGGAITLRRGAGLLLLVPSSRAWRGLSKPLGGSIIIREHTYSYYTIAQLMTAEGLILQGGQQQRVSVRAAGEFAAGDQALSGNWAKQPHVVMVWPGETLLLWEQPSHKLGSKFVGDAASFAYPALYSSFTEERITAAIGASVGH